MKKRNGFVSNSSSSSFIIAGNIDTEIEVKMSVNVTRFCDDYCTTKEELDHYFTHNWGCDLNYIEEEKWFKEQYENCLAAIKEGKTIFFCEASSDSEDSLSYSIYNGAKINIKDGEVIYNEN